jgi:mannose-6-phosphate isomerase
MHRMNGYPEQPSRRPWGFFEVLAEGPGHKVKRITIHPGQRLSLQRHLRRSEHWVVAAGRALVTLEGRDIPLGEGEALDIPRQAAHRAANAGDGPLVFIEIQRGDYLGEEDIVRLEDDYGRLLSPPSGPDPKIS